MRFALIACALSLVVGVAQARDVELKLPIKDVLESAEFKEKVGDSIKFYFGDQPAPAGVKSLGEVVTNKKTNAFGKSDEVACRWVMLSALIQLKERAISDGADAVTAVSSFYKKDAFSSATEYECHAGAFVAGVALKATLIKTK